MPQHLETMNTPLMGTLAAQLQENFLESLRRSSARPRYKKEALKRYKSYRRQ